MALLRVSPEAQRGRITKPRPHIYIHTIRSGRQDRDIGCQSRKFHVLTYKRWRGAGRRVRKGGSPGSERAAGGRRGGEGGGGEGLDPHHRAKFPQNLSAGRSRFLPPPQPHPAARRTEGPEGSEHIPPSSARKRRLAHPRPSPPPPPTLAT